MPLGLRCCFYFGLEARPARVDSDFAAVYQRPCLGSCVFKSSMLQPPPVLSARRFLPPLLGPSLKPWLPSLVQLADSTTLSLGRAVKDVSRQSSVFSGFHSEEQPFCLVLPKLWLKG